MIDKLEAYFLSEEKEQITLNDRVWFYGPYLAIAFNIILLVCKL